MQEINEHVANALRTVRAERKLSLDAAAKITGVSKAMLGQIERGESCPTLTTLWKIATGFKLSLSRLLEPDLSAHVIEVRQLDALRKRPVDDEMLVAPIFRYDQALGFEMFELTLPAGYERLSEPHVAGATEHIVVISGHMDLFVEQQWLPMKAGSAIRFQADKVHGYRNTSAEPTVFHNIINYRMVTCAE